VTDPDGFPDDVVEHTTAGVTGVAGADNPLFGELTALLALSTPPPSAHNLADRLNRVQDLVVWIRSIHRRLEETAIAAADAQGSLMWTRGWLANGVGFVIRSGVPTLAAVARVNALDAVCDHHAAGVAHDLFDPAAVARHIQHNSPGDVLVRVIAERAVLNVIDKVLANAPITVNMAAAHLLAEQVVIRMAAGYAPHSEDLGLTPPEGPATERAGVRLVAGALQVWQPWPDPGRWVCGTADYDNPSGVCGADVPCASHSREDPPE
jgi:hypothetical protein